MLTRREAIEMKSKTHDLSKLLAEAEKAAINAANNRDVAIATSVRVCRSLEEKLTAALGGEPLRGLPNIGSGSRPQYLLRVRTRARIGEPLEARDVLCLSHTGQLVMARMGIERPVLDTEILAGDAQDFAYALGMALERHIENADRSSSRFDALTSLSDRIEKALKGE